MKQSNGIFRRIAPAVFVALTLGAASIRALGQMSPQAIDDAKAAAAWTNLGPHLTNISFERLPVQEVARATLNMFSNQFDVILPSAVGDVDVYPVNLQLKSVAPAEVFNAMNLLFDADKAPFRWQLILNGARPTAVLQVVKKEPHQGEQRSTSVFYIGDLLVTPEQPHVGFTPEDLISALRRVEDSAGFPDPPSLSLHQEASLLVFTGTRAAMDLTKQTLSALQDKVKHDRERVEKLEQKQKDNQERKEAGMKPGQQSTGGSPGKTN